MGMKGRWHGVLAKRGRAVTTVDLAAPRPRAAFSTGVTTIDGVITGEVLASSLNVTRETALRVPAVLRGRNLICSISTLPLTQYGPGNSVERSSLLEQIDPQVPNITMVAQTVEDLLFDGIAWWVVTDRGWNAFPSKARRVDPSRVHLEPPPGADPLSLLPSGADPNGAVWIDTRVVDGANMIRFDSPNPPLLVTAQSAIRRAVKLENAAEMYADNPRPLDYFTPADGADPADDEDIVAMLTAWAAARRARATGYVPASVVYNAVQMPTPADLQLVQLQQRAALDIANVMGLDPEDLGVSTTSRTYQNATDRRKDRINDVLAPYMRAVTDRLSMNDVTRRGYRVLFDLTDYLKADPITRATVASTLHGLGAVTVDEIRQGEGLPPLTAAQKRELKPEPAPPAQPPASPAPADKQPIGA